MFFCSSHSQCNYVCMFQFSSINSLRTREFMHRKRNLSDLYTALELVTHSICVINDNYMFRNWYYINFGFVCRQRGFDRFREIQQHYYQLPHAKLLSLFLHDRPLNTYGAYRSDIIRLSLTADANSQSLFIPLQVIAENRKKFKTIFSYININFLHNL